MTTVTPAGLAALLLHLNESYAKSMSTNSNISGQNIATCSPCTIELVETKAALPLQLIISFAAL